jgi:hypothetical protein
MLEEPILYFITKLFFQQGHESNNYLAANVFIVTKSQKLFVNNAIGFLLFINTVCYL